MRFTLNATAIDVTAHPMTRLLDVLRDECGLKGTKDGCGEGECGACTVLLNGVPVVACLVPFSQVEHAAVTTIEGLPHAQLLQQAFMDLAGAQCGICTPGMIVAASVLGDDPTLVEIQSGLSGNLCRCTGYAAIFRAVLAAKRDRQPT